MTSHRITIATVDDELLARRFLRRMLKTDPELELVGEYDSGREAIEGIRTTSPDLVLLDIQMPQVDGFAVVEALAGDGLLPVIIFVTAFDEYALRAFEAHALDYLLKPFDQARFDRVIRRAKEQLRLRELGRHEAQIASLIQSLKPERDYLERLLVKTAGRGAVIIKVEQIDWVKAEDKYARLHIGGVSHLIRQSLNALERQLDPKRFIRVHRSTIINVERIKALQPLFNGDQLITMASGEQLTLSRNYRDRLRELLGSPL